MNECSMHFPDIPYQERMCGKLVCTIVLFILFTYLYRFETYEIIFVIDNQFCMAHWPINLFNLLAMVYFTIK